MKNISTFIYLAIVIITCQNGWSQCSCTNCPLFVPNNATVTSEINVSGLTNSTHGVGGQGICAINISLETDAIEELDMYLTTPSGDIIYLMDRISGFGINQNLVFNITFLPCSIPAFPDPGYPAVFTNSAYDPASNTTFTGSYYPSDNQCFEDLTGSANGTYILTLADFIVGDPHTLVNWEIIFCDGTGLSCTSGPTCEPGELISLNPNWVTACEGDPTALLLNNFSLNWGSGGPPDPNLYGMTYLVQDINNQVLERSDTPDLTAYPPGDYIICGLSYLLSDEPLLPPLTGGYPASQVFNDILNGVYCGDVSSLCTTVTINANEPDPIMDWPSSLTICAGTLYTFTILNFDPNTVYSVAVTNGSFNQLNITPSGEIQINANIGPNIDICVSISGDCDNGQNCVSLAVSSPGTAPILSGPNGLCLGEEGTVTIANYQSSNQYTWEISGPATITNSIPSALQFQSIGVGVVEVCATNISSCANQTCFSIPVNEPTPPSTNALATYCLPTNFFNGNTNGPSTSILWEQMSGPGTISFANLNVVATQWTADLPGIYVVRLTKELDGCITFEEVTIELLPSANPPLLLGDLNLCENDISNVEIQSPDPNATYTWTTSGPVSITSNNGTNIDILINGVGAVEVCAEASNSCGNEVTCLQGFIESMLPPIPNNDPTYCFPGSFFDADANGSFDNIEWIQISGPGTIAFDNANNLQTAWTVDLIGTYTVELRKVLGPCEVSEIFTFEVVTGPMVTEVVTCANGQFTIELTFSGGMPPYAVFGAPISGNVYTSTPYASGSAVLTTYEDGNGCMGQFFVQEFCNCISDAGTMVTSPQVFCSQVGVAVGLHNGDETLDSDDVGQYVLHTGAGNTLGTVLDINNTGQFSFLPSMSLGVTYYLSYMVGTDDGIGNVDLSDPCLSVAFGQPVIWYDNPNLELQIANDPIACDLQLILQATNSFPTVTNATYSWSIVSGPAGGIATFANPNQSISNVVFSEAGSYEVMVSMTFVACTYDAVLTIDVIAPLVSNNLQINCDPQSGTYTVAFDVSGGNLPYTIDGVVTNGTSFVSTPIILGTPYSFSVLDGGDCVPLDLSGVDNCICASDAGFILAEPLAICQGESANVVVSGATLDGNDIGIYVLHDNAGASLGTVIDQNSIGVFSFLPSMVLGQSYWISYVVGNESNGTIDYNDPCLSVAQGIEVVWSAPATIDLVDSIATCANSVIINVSTNPSANVTWSNAPTALLSDGIFDILNTQQIVYERGSNGDHLLLAEASSGNCLSYDSILVTFLPQVSVENIVERCNGFTYTVSFDITGSPPFSVNGQSIVGNTFISNDFNSGVPYAFDVMEANGCIFSNITGSRNCECDSDAGTMSQAAQTACGLDETLQVQVPTGFVIDQDDRGVFVLHDRPEPALGTVIALNTTGEFEFVPPMVAGQVYYASYVVGNQLGDDSIDFGDPCLDVTAGVPLTWYEVPRVSYTEEMAICGDSIRLFGEGFIPPFVTKIRLLSGAGIIVTQEVDTNEILLIVDKAGNYSIEVSTENGACIAFDTIQVEVDFIKNFSLFADTLLCGNLLAISDSLGGEPLVISTNQSGVDILQAAGRYQLSSEVFTTASIYIGLPNSVCNEMDSFEVTFVPEITVESIDLSCNQDGSLADLTVTWNGGSNSYFFNGSKTSDTTFTLTGVPTGSWLLVTIVDSLCGTYEDSIYVTCGCVTTPAELPSELVLLCQGEDIVTSILDRGIVGLEDSLIFILHRGSRNSIVNILDLSFTPTFAYNAQWLLYDTLWISPFTGKIDTAGMPQFLDSCAQIGFGQPFTFIDEVDIEYELANSICLGEEAWITFAVNSPNYPVTLDIIIGNQVQQITIQNRDRIFYTFVPMDTSLSALVSINDAPCGFDPIVIDIQSEDCSCTTYTYLAEVTVCNPSNEVNLALLEQDGFPAQYTILAGEGVIDGEVLRIDTTYQGTLVVSARPLLPDACDSTYTILFDVFFRPELFLSEVALSICPEETTIIDLNDYLLSSIANVQWTSGPSIDPTALPNGTSTIEAIIPATTQCPAIRNTISIDKTAPLAYIITSNNPACAELLGSISIVLEDTTFLNSVSLGEETVYTLMIDDLRPGNYFVTLQDTNQCIYEESMEILSVDPIEVDLSNMVTMTIEGDTYKVTAITAGGTAPYNFTWIVGEDTLTNQADSIILLLSDDTEIVILVEDANGCTAEDFIILQIGEDEPWQVANAIRLGGGTNGTISIPATSAISEVLSWAIYDRWGNKVFSAQGFDPNQENISWNGQFNGLDMTPGVYVYHLRYLNRSGQMQDRYGDITVMK